MTSCWCGKLLKNHCVLRRLVWKERGKYEDRERKQIQTFDSFNYELAPVEIAPQDDESEECVQKRMHLQKCSWLVSQPVSQSVPPSEGKLQNQTRIGASSMLFWWQAFWRRPWSAGWESCGASGPACRVKNKLFARYARTTFKKLSSYCLFVTMAPALVRPWSWRHDKTSIH